MLDSKVIDEMRDLMSIGTDFNTAYIESVDKINQKEFLDYAEYFITEEKLLTLDVVFNSGIREYVLDSDELKRVRLENEYIHPETKKTMINAEDFLLVKFTTKNQLVISMTMDAIKEWNTRNPNSRIYDTNMNTVVNMAIDNSTLIGGQVVLMVDGEYFTNDYGFGSAYEWIDQFLFNRCNDISNNF